MVRADFRLVLTFASFGPALVISSQDLADRPSDRPLIAIDKAYMDLTVPPGEDFYDYVNGNWLKKNPIPPGHHTWGTFTILREQNAARLKAILESALADRNPQPGSPTQILGDYYRSAMDTAGINKAGKNQLSPFFDLIDGIKTVDDLARVIGELHRSAAPQAVFLFYKDVDREKPQTAIASLKQGGFALPGRNYYLDETAESVALRKKYQAHVQAMFRLLGEPDGAALGSAETVLRLETLLAKNSLTSEQERDPKLTFHKMGLAALHKLAPQFPWRRYFSALGLPTDRDVNVVTPAFFKGLGEMVERVPLANWKVYLKWNTLTTNAPLLSEDFVQENFNFFEKTLNGASELKPRWQRVLAQLEEDIGWALAQEYVRRHFSPRAKEKMLVMIDDIRSTFRERLARLDWMSDPTRQRALVKLDKITVNVGYPERWPDFSGMRVTPSGYLANVAGLNGYHVSEAIKKIALPVERTGFGMTPQQVGAYYSAAQNKIVLPAGILQQPFFHESFDAAVNYGAVGCVIAHEFTHAFDDEGSQYDGEGRLSNWWSDEDLKRFKAKQKLIIDQYDGYTVLDNLRLNGTLTVGENIADLGGVSISFDAFERYQKRNGRQKDIDGFTPEQRFFISWAQLWRVHMTPEAIRRRVKTDTSSYHPFRVIGPLSNLDGFIDAFHLKEGDKMVREPRLRIRIW